MQEQMKLFSGTAVKIKYRNAIQIMILSKLSLKMTVNVTRT